MNSLQKGVSHIYNFLGTIKYQEAVDIMESKFIESVEQKKIFWWGLQHPTVYTKGVAFQNEHLIQNNIDIISVRRGGSITVHNEGQLIFYSVVPIELVVGGLAGYIRNLEASMIETLWSYNIVSFLNPPFSGVWTEKGKIAFVGLGLKKGVIYHGISINLNNNLEEYRPIFSCGLSLPVTRLIDVKTIFNTKIADGNNLMEDFSRKLYNNILKRFTSISPQEFREQVYNQYDIFCETFFSFRLGQNYFNERRYWEAHESWEMSWKNYPIGNEYRIFLQGLIQLASACYKSFSIHKNLDGALSLFEKSLQKFLEVPHYIDTYIKQIEETPSLIEYIQANIETLTTRRNDFKYSPYVICFKHDRITPSII